MGVSLAFVAILIVLDVLFLATFWTLKNVRRLTDVKMFAKRHHQQSESENEHEDDEIPQNSDETNSGTSTLCGCIAKECLLCYDVFFGCILGYTTLEDNCVRRFPEWKPLPYKCGIVATCALLVLAGVLLSPELILGQFGMDMGAAAPQLCSLNSEMKGIEEKIANAANLELAQKQLNYTVTFREALVNDTTLYGTTGYECRNIKDQNGEVLASGKKKDWSEDTNGPFFPGYCEDALEAALQAAKNTVCTKRVCGCEFSVCIAGITGVCVETPYVCEKHTNDQEQELMDYRMEQQRRGSISQATKINVTSYSGEAEAVKDIAEEVAAKIFRQMDVAGTIYIAYSCLALFFPSPLMLFRTPLSVKIKQTVFGVQKHVFILLVIAIWWGFEYFHRLRFFVPSVQLYLQNLQANPCYADPQFIQARERAMTSTCMELMMMESEWKRSSVTIKNILAEVHHFVNTCNCAFPLENLKSFISPQYIREDDAVELGFRETVENMFAECKYVIMYMEAGEIVHSLIRLLFKPFPACLSVERIACPGAQNQNIFVPHDGVSFLGNTTMCTESEFARNQLFQAADNGLTWSEVWIKTGLIASMIIKFVVSNFCLNLLRVVDPFTECGGKFEQPPPQYFKLDSASMVDVQEYKAAILSRIALIRSFFWGVIMQWCVLTLAFSIYDDYKDIFILEVKHDDLVVGAILFFVVSVVLCGAVFANIWLKRQIRAFQQVSPVPEGGGRGNPSEHYDEFKQNSRDEVGGDSSLLRDNEPGDELHEDRIEEGKPVVL